MAYEPHSDDRPTFAELKGLKRRELRNLYDSVAKGEGRNPTHATFYLEEIRRREASRREWWLLWLTIAIAVLTLANLYVVFVDTNSHDEGRHHQER